MFFFLLIFQLEYRLLPQNSAKQFVFRSEDSSEMGRWVKALTNAISTSLGKKIPLNYVSNIERFWRKEYFLESEFREQAQTGDLLLFRGNRPNAVFQRRLTWGEFDHVAVVLKNVRGDILLFEASGGVGVGIFPWNRLVAREWYRDQDKQVLLKIVYRELAVDRSKEFLAEVENFVNQNLGKKYEFSFQKMMRRESMVPTEGEVPQQPKTFFCSELVAKLYKTLGLLPPHKSSTQYWPGCFSEQKQLQLCSDGKYGPAHLGREKIIIFQQVFLKNKFGYKN